MKEPRGSDQYYHRNSPPLPGGSDMSSSHGHKLSRSQYDAQKKPPSPSAHLHLEHTHRKSLRSAGHTHLGHVAQGYRSVAKSPHMDNHPKVGKARYV